MRRRSGEDQAEALETLVKAHGGELTLRVTDLLDRFGHFNLSGLEQLLQDELREFEVEPAQVERFYSVRLRRRDHPLAPCGVPTRSVLTPDGQVRRLADGDALPEQGVYWVDLENPTRDQAKEAVADALRRCGETLDAAETERLVDDLSERDYRPTIHAYRADAGVRNVACFVVRHDEQTDADARDATASKAGGLTFWPLELAVGKRMLITVRRPGERFATVTRPDRALAEPRAGAGSLPLETLEAEIVKRWGRGATPETMTAGDAGLMVLHWVADDYVRALRAIDAWLRQWELSVLDRDERPERATLVELRDMLREVDARVGYFFHPHGDDAHRGWMPAVTVADEARHVRSVLHRLERTLERLEQRVDDRLEAAAQLEQDRSQQRFERIGFLLLFPALITGFFGANTNIPGEGTWVGFWVMTAAMVVLTGAIYFAFVHNRAGRRRRKVGG